MAELLTEHGLRGTFYIPRASQKPTATPAQIRELGALFELGAHTLNHVDLARAEDAVARAEIIESKAWLEETSGRTCAMFCPPMGRYGQRHMPVIREAGYQGMRTVELLSLSWPGLTDGLWVMPTTLQAYPHRAMAYAKNALRRYAVHNLWLYILHGKPGGWDEMAESLARRTLRSGGVFHLWGHSWELEETAQWKRLGKVLEMLGRLKGQAANLTNGQVCVASQRRHIAADPDQAAAVESGDG